MDDEQSASEAPAIDPKGLGRQWSAEITRAEKAQSKWVKRSEKIEKIYRDERELDGDRSRRFNVLWSNVETLRPAVYARTPKAAVSRRYGDRNPVARLTAVVLERALQTSCELYDFDYAIDQCVRDRLLGGRGQAWALYEPTIVGEPGAEQIAYEKARIEYVPWRDFLHAPARTWGEVGWVARRAFLTRRELRERFGEAAKGVALDHTTKRGDDDDGRSKAVIWEIWDKTSGQVIVFAPGTQGGAVLQAGPPPVNFAGFFPCPRPLLATTTGESLLPTPDYAMYQDQAEELNDLTRRIGVLQKALRVVGVYPAQAEEIGAVLTENGDNKMLPVKNWAMFANAGGLKGQIDWFPVERVVQVLGELYKAREAAKQDLYEVTGLSDILRGASDASETATAQQIKAQWGSVRVRRLQADVQRFARDLIRLKAEIMAEHFQMQSLVEAAGIDGDVIAKYVPTGEDPMQLMQAVEALLRQETARTFAIDVETDSTLEADEQADRRGRIEFLSAVTPFLKEAAALAAGGPEAAKLAGELLMFGVRGFRQAAGLEEVIEAAATAAGQKPPAPQADPMQAKMAEVQGKLQLREQEVRGKLEIEAGKVAGQQALQRDRLATAP